MTQTDEKTKKLSNAIAEISNVVLLSTRDAFSKMMDVKIDRKEVKTIDRNASLHGITSVISMTGELNGTVCLSVTQETALAMAHRMMGMEFKEVDALVSSCISEFANVIAGGSKMALSEKQLDIGLPNMIRGTGCQIDFPASAQPLCVSYECELGPFLLVFGFTD